MRQAAAGATAALVLAFGSCSPASSPPLVAPPPTATDTNTNTTLAPDPGGHDPGGHDLSAEQRRRADELVSLFENSTTELQYGYSEELGDGRGVTAGRAGFTSATGDLALVVERYCAANPGSPLAAFLPELERLAAEGSDATGGLRGFAAAWADAAGDPAMRHVQDQVVEELYLQPALEVARSAGLRLPLSIVSVYDTAIQHGVGPDADGLPALVEEATALAGRPERDEVRWLATFLDVRQAHLEHAADPATRAAWRESTGRVDTLRALLDAGNTEFGPATVDVYGDRFELS